MNKKALIILSGLFLMILVTTNQSLSIKYKEDEGGRCPIMPPNYYKTENLKKEKLNNYFETMSIKFKGKYTYMNKSGDLITTKKFEKASPFTEERAFVMENDKWGIIDTSGNYVVEPQFDDFVPYYNGMAQVGIKTDEILDVEYAVVTGSGYVTITKYRHKWGIIDKNGNYILKPSYNSSFKFYEGTSPVESGNKMGYINEKGKEIIPPKYDKTCPFFQDIAVIINNKKFGMIDKTGKEILEPQYDKISYFNEDLSAVEINGQYGFINKQGEFVIQPQFDFAENFSDGYAVITQQKKKGYIDITGRIVIPCQYDNAYKFENGKAKVSFSKQVKYINSEGKEASITHIESQYIDKNAQKTSPPDGVSLSSYSQTSINGKSALKDNNSYRILCETNLDYNLEKGILGRGIVNYNDEIFSVFSNNRYGLIDKNCNVIKEPVFDMIGKFSEGLAPIKLNNMWGYIDTRGNIVIEPKFDEVNRFVNNKARVTKNGNMMLINKQGENINPHKLDCVAIGPFSEGLAVITIHEENNHYKYGYVDEAYNVVLEPSLDYASPFSEGLAIVGSVDPNNFNEK